MNLATKLGSPLRLRMSFGAAAENLRLVTCYLFFKACLRSERVNLGTKLGSPLRLKLSFGAATKNLRLVTCY